MERTQMLPKQFNFMPLLMVVSLISLVWTAGLTFFLFKMVRHYRRLTSKVKKKDLKSVLDKIVTQLKVQEKELGSLSKKLDKLDKASDRHLQKIGFVRFNPFSDTGGDQSFCLSLLDEQDSGIVLSSLHSRGKTRLYAKSVSKGKGRDFELSKEEKETIKKAKKGR